MMIGQKKIQNYEQNWFVVLNPIPSEIDKRKVSQKISEVFSLSTEEALDLVSNTPIILLDNLTKSVAGKLRDYFRVSGASITLSNDTLFKRKCYRTVWPQQPNLNFLHQWNPEQKAESSEGIQEVLDPDQALNEIRSLHLHDPARTDSPINVWSVAGGQVTTHERPYQDKSASENKPPQAETVPIVVHKDSKPAEVERPADDHKLRALEEKYNAMNDEYRQARQVFEEKLLYLRQENQDLRKRIDESMAQSEALAKEKQRLQASLEERHVIREKVDEEKELFQKQLEQRFIDLQKELEVARQKNEDFQGVIRNNDSTKVRLEAQIAELQSQSLYWKDKASALTLKIEDCERKSDDERSHRKHLEDKIHHFEIALHESERKVKDYSMQRWPMEELTAAFLKLEETLSLQGKVLQNLLDRVEDKERRIEKIELGIKENQEVNLQIVQENFKQITSRIHDKENLLSKLVSEQQIIEKEIRQKEEALRKVLQDQETVEKDILNVKHSQTVFEKKRGIGSADNA